MITWKSSIKISIVGDGGNGKTSLINKFVSGDFESVTNTTIGIDYKTKIIDVQDYKVKLQIWDTAGQERFSSIVKVCYRDSRGIIITYDTTNYESFKNLQKWVDEVKSIVDESKAEFILVGTKNDLVSERNVPMDEVVDFVKRNNLRYLETSSKEGKNVNLLFSIFAEMIEAKTEKNKLISLQNKETIPNNTMKQEKVISNDMCCIVS